MAAIVAGQRIRASDLNSNLPRIARCTADTTRTSNTTLQDVTGMGLSVEANAIYALDCYVAYDAGTTGDLKLAWTGPTGITGHWVPWGLGSAATQASDVVNAARVNAFGAANTAVVGGPAGAAACHPKGYVVISSTAGTLQLQMAQNTSNGTATTVRAGSWMRLTRIL